LLSAFPSPSTTKSAVAKKKHSTLFMFFVISALGLLALTGFSIGASYWQAQNDPWGATIIAHKLYQRPVQYFSLSNPDAYVLEALSNPGKPVYPHFFDKTQIDELVQAQGVNNVEFNGNYYRVDLLYSDPVVWSISLFHLALFGWVLLGILTPIALAARYISNRLKKN
jgi:hypothetical protein